MQRQTAAAAAILLSFVVSAHATEPPISGRHGPGPHMLDAQPFANPHGRAATRHSRKVASKRKAQPTTRHARRGYEGHARVVQSGPPPGCPPRLWCGCWLAKHLGINDRSLWLARNWAHVGSPASGPAPGVIAVFARGRRGGHVGQITAVLGPGRIMLLSGNDGRAVRERERSTRGVIAYRNVGARYASR